MPSLSDPTKRLQPHTGAHTTSPHTSSTAGKTAEKGAPVDPLDPQDEVEDPSSHFLCVDATDQTPHTTAVTSVTATPTDKALCDSESPVEMVEVDVGGEAVHDRVAPVALRPLSPEDLEVGEIRVENARFEWPSASASALSGVDGTSGMPFTLGTVDVRIRPGELVAVVGSVGCGKSSLAMALLGEMPIVQGRVTAKGRRAFVPQQAWIMNATLRTNVTFGRSFDPRAFAEALDACAMEHDLKLLQKGDMTWIGDRGINLSGGQKQRVSIARSLYSEANIVVMDDPLSAVDSHVSEHIFHKCIRGAMAGRTRLFVTNQVQYLPFCDRVIVIENGVIAACGTASEIGAHLERFGVLAESAPRNVDDCTEDDVDVVTPAATTEAVTAAEDMKTDDVAPSSAHGAGVSGGVSGGVSSEPALPSAVVAVVDEAEDDGAWQKRSSFWSTFVYAMGGPWMLALVAFVQGWATVLSVVINGVLSFWSTRTFDLTNHQYMGLLAGVSGLYVVFVFTRSVGFSAAARRTGTDLHTRLLRRVLRAPMSFFDTTPAGHIIGWLSADIGGIDTRQHPSAEMASILTCATALYLVLMVVILPWMLAGVVPLVVVYVALARFYRPGVTAMKRLEASTNPPIFAQFKETLEGLATIRAYGLRDAFSKGNERRVDGNNRSAYCLHATEHWFAFAIDLCGALVLLGTALVAVAQRGDTKSSLSALSIFFAVSLSVMINMMTRQQTEQLRLLNTIESLRVRTRMPVEAAPIIEGNRPAEHWPNKGHISIRNIMMRYRKGDRAVLDNVTCDIHPCEKIGIVGRTGSGKSSLVSALFRLVELECGSITVDGVNIADIGLDDLRSRFAIITQDPVLFSGSVKTNLDPFNVSSDEEMWEALELSHLAATVRTLPGGLDATVSENGENFSAGTRQQFSLARALLRRPRVLVLDEATSSIDNGTDALIQAALRRACKDATVLTIAHRLNTVMDSDKILVLSAGNIVEFDHPHTLLQHKTSAFAQMVAATGPANSELLRNMARDAWVARKGNQ
eukprot:Opistho-2@63284